jgi:hypothetical protein
MIGNIYGSKTRIRCMVRGSGSVPNVDSELREEPDKPRALVRGTDFQA